jgi:hypothetical protein
MLYFSGSSEQYSMNDTAYSGGVKNGGAIPPLPNTSSWRDALLIKHTDNFVFDYKLWNLSLCSCFHSLVSSLRWRQVVSLNRAEECSTVVRYIFQLQAYKGANAARTTVVVGEKSQNDERKGIELATSARDRRPVLFRGAQRWLLSEGIIK